MGHKQREVSILLSLGGRNEHSYIKTTVKPVFFYHRALKRVQCVERKTDLSEASVDVGRLALNGGSKGGTKGQDLATGTDT